MARHDSQIGSVIEWLIFGIVIVGVSMLIAWRYIEADREQNEAQRALSNPSLFNNKKPAAE